MRQASPEKIVKNVCYYLHTVHKSQMCMEILGFKRKIYKSPLKIHNFDNSQPKCSTLFHQIEIEISVYNVYCPIVTLKMSTLVQMMHLGHQPPS